MNPQDLQNNNKNISQVPQVSIDQDTPPVESPNNYPILNKNKILKWLFIAAILIFLLVIAGIVYFQKFSGQKVVNLITKEQNEKNLDLVISSSTGISYDNGVLLLQGESFKLNKNLILKSEDSQSYQFILGHKIFGFNINKITGKESLLSAQEDIERVRSDVKSYADSHSGETKKEVKIIDNAKDDIVYIFEYNENGLPSQIMIKRQFIDQKLGAYFIVGYNYNYSGSDNLNKNEVNELITLINSLTAGSLLDVSKKISTDTDNNASGSVLSKQPGTANSTSTESDIDLSLVEKIQNKYCSENVPSSLKIKAFPNQYDTKQIERAGTILKTTSANDLSKDILSGAYNDSESSLALTMLATLLLEQSKVDPAIQIVTCAAEKYYNRLAMQLLSGWYYSGSRKYPEYFKKMKLKPVDYDKSYYWVSAIIYSELGENTGFADAGTGGGYKTIALLDGLQNDPKTTGLTLEKMKEIEVKVREFVAKKYPIVATSKNWVYMHSMQAVQKAMSDNPGDLKLIEQKNSY